MTSVSALGMTVSVPSARPDRIGSIERWMTSSGTQRPHRVVDDHDVVVGPVERRQPVAGALVAGRAAGDHAHGHRRATPPRRARASRRSSPGGTTTTTRSTDAAPRARSVRSRIGSPASRTNCFGISPPNRLPSPPARTIAWICTRRDYVSAASRDRAGRDPAGRAPAGIIGSQHGRAAARPPSPRRRPGPRADLGRLAPDPGAAPGPDPPTPSFDPAASASGTRPAAPPCPSPAGRPTTRPRPSAST